MSCSQLTIERTDPRARPLPAVSRANRCRDMVRVVIALPCRDTGSAFPFYREASRTIRPVSSVSFCTVPAQGAIVGFSRRSPGPQGGFICFLLHSRISQQRPPDHTGLPVPDISFRHGTGDPKPFALTGTEHHTHQAELPTCNNK